MRLRIAYLHPLAAVLLFPLIAAANEADPSADASAAIPQASMEAQLAAAFEQKGLRFGAPVFLRIYKQSSEVELWVSQGARYRLFKTYSICRWSGTLGPKLTEGDRQSPEGLYHIAAGGLIVNRRWHRAMRLNYPNAFDLVNGRTGSGILIHGKCRSVGCFALRDGNAGEVYAIVEAALRAGQLRVPVLSLPFRSSDKLDEAGIGGPEEFWSELRRADLLFNRDRIPPSAWLCSGRYYFDSRRGGRRRHVIPLRGCRPFAAPLSVEEAAAARARILPIAAARAGALTSKEAALSAARSCDPRALQCRLLRVAVTSEAICPKKYGRCRTPQAAYTKSVECPLKYPRCRWFVGPDPKGATRAARSAAASKGRKVHR